MTRRSTVFLVAASLFLAGGIHRATAQDKPDDPAALDEQLGERALPDEAQTDQQIADTISGYINRRFAEGRRPALRDAHAKAHGCVRATFNVETELPAELRHGVFVPGKQYKAWIRFSNGASEVAPDKAKDARGMAIKLTGVPGDKIIPEEKSEATQDFIMINHPFFFVDDPKEYLKALKAFHERLLFDKTNDLNTLATALQLGLHDTRLALEINGTKIANPLFEQYWSMTPYRLGTGPNRRAIKFFAKPCSDDRPKPPGFLSRPEDDYLQTAMAKTLAGASTCFGFYVQSFKDFQSTPVEQSTVEWKEADAPPVLVAKVNIDTQKFDSKAQMTFCENLSFTPWHALPDHKPLGTVNRARRIIYTAISKVRHNLNGASRAEPTGNETF